MKLKKMIVSLVTAAVAAMSLCNVMTASATDMRSTFRIYYSAVENSGLSTVNTHLVYNSNTVEVKKVFQGVLGGSCGFGQNTAGIMDVSYENSSNIYSGGVLLVVSFDAPLNVTSLNNYVSQSIRSVKNTAGTSLSVADTISTTTVLVGDVNQNGSINANDLLLLKKYLLGTATLENDALKAADVDGNFVVNEDDLELLRQYQLGLITSFSK